MKSDVSIKIAGSAGQGIQTVGYILGKVLTRSGYYVFAMQDNESRIRGGQNFFQIRASTNPVNSPTTRTDIYIALNEESLALHINQLSEEALVIFDSEHIKTELKYPGAMPLARIAAEKGGEKIYANAVALGATIAVLTRNFDVLEAFLRQFFSQNHEVAEKNCVSARAGYDFALQHFSDGSLVLSSCTPSQRMFVSGHEAIGLGALASGCQFFSAYPMSPSTSIFTYLASQADQFNMVVEQAEDEIAAISMALGASFTGVRAMTATSGGGFSLMVESLGLSAISETPLVIVNAQRPGPATGLPTRTEQGDLRFVLHASQGEFPRIIISPATAKDAFYLTVKSFHLAEKYQIPVIILTDQHLAESYYTEDRFDLSRIQVDRFFPSAKQLDNYRTYLRYQFTETGVSARIPPSFEGRESISDSHEHSEDGHITEDALLRKKMMEKRFKKLESVMQEMSPPLSTGSDSVDLLIIGWGSTYGVLKEVTDHLLAEGVAVRLLHFQEIWPFPKAVVEDAIVHAGKWLVVENNYTAQLAGIIKEHTCRTPTCTVLKYDGRPFLFEEVFDRIKQEALLSR